ncbi:element excision factor XisI family protein [Okeania sp. KiyG1]|uniref:element excision factor XisI family protein n=1 Tax=Okeania sp. KiyG1 TaxID=2720165 RepID=UPI001F2E2F29|nr:element excision factor XisI family protein [Okeania sp. KiyG1]
MQIIDNKIWIQRDGIEEGIATDLMEAGIPKEQIVLGLKRNIFALIPNLQSNSIPSY